MQMGKENKEAKQLKKEVIKKVKPEIRLLEKKLQKKLGFKEEWFDDGSGYWLTKSYKHKNVKIGFNISSDEKSPFDIWLKHKDMHCDLPSESTMKDFKFNKIKSVDSELKRMAKIFKKIAQ
jgi:hypothetical protein